MNLAFITCGLGGDEGRLIYTARSPDKVSSTEFVRVVNTEKDAG